MKYLSLDVGEKRIGVAVTDEEGIVARPLLTLAVGEELFTELGKIVQEEKPGSFVLGLPRHMSGELGDAVAQIRKLGEGLHHEFTLPVFYQDESLSSVEAEKRLRERGFDHKKIKEMVDAEAAAVILEDFLAEGKTQ